MVHKIVVSHIARWMCIVTIRSVWSLLRGLVIPSRHGYRYALGKRYKKRSFTMHWKVVFDIKSETTFQYTSGLDVWMYKANGLRVGLSLEWDKVVSDRVLARYYNIGLLLDISIVHWKVVLEVIWGNVKTRILKTFIFCLMTGKRFYDKESSKIWSSDSLKADSNS